VTTKRETELVRLVATQRDGNVLSPTGVRYAQRVASAVCTDDGLEWHAPSTASALAWLLLRAHKRATSSPVLARNDLSDDLLLPSFRGQAAKYEQLVPSIDRPANASGRTTHLRTFEWVHVLLQLWFNRTMARPYHIDRIESEATAQHYGIPTNYVDWTWDPEIAFHFAAAQLAPGERAVVLVRLIHPEARDQVLLPPSFIRRVWRQYGLFQRIESLTADAWLELERVDRILSLAERSRRSVESYERVSFTVDAATIAIARRRIDALTSRRDPLRRIVRWAKTMAELGLIASKSLMFFPELDDVANATHVSGVPLPLPHRGMRLPSVNRRTAATYVDKVARRRCGSKRGYSAAAAKLLYDGLGPHVLLRPIASPAAWEWLVQKGNYLYAILDGRPDFLVRPRSKRKNAA
jgi:hypothetical protein